MFGTELAIRKSNLLQSIGIPIAYIIGHYNPSVRFTTWLLTPLILYALILEMSDGTYSLKSTDFQKTFSSQFYLLSDILPEIYLD